MPSDLRSPAVWPGAGRRIWLRTRLDRGGHYLPIPQDEAFRRQQPNPVHPDFQGPVLDYAEHCRYTRVVAHDNTIRLGPRWVQLPRRRAYTGRRLEVRECLDGRLLVFADGQCLATQPAPAADFILRPRRSPSGDRGRRRPASPRPVAEGGRYPPPLRKPPLSSRTPAPSTPRSPSPTHPWRHSSPYSTRSRGMTFSRNS
jgi:hypothetical protein